jgi:hypothetical protein
VTATNHALTGAIIGLVVASPAALPLAFLSHYLLDALPHFGWPEDRIKVHKSKVFQNYLIAEAFLCFLIVLVLFITQPANWGLAAVCAFLAAAPDLFSMGRYFKERAGKLWKPNVYQEFASRIQWFERPIGGIVEIAWFGGAAFILANLL